MKFTYYYLLSIVMLLSFVNNVVSMEFGLRAPIKCFNNATNREMLSLKKLCINTIVESLQKNNIDILLSKNMGEQISSLPEELQTKITSKLFCYKFGYQCSYKQDIFGHYVMLDETNNQVIVTNKEESTLTFFDINGEQINSFAWPSRGSWCHDGSLIVQQNRQYEGSIDVIKNGNKKTINGGRSPQYCNIMRILKNQHELVFWTNDNKYSLYNFYQGSKPLYSNVDSIQFDKSEAICMTRSNDTVTVSTPKRDDLILTSTTIKGSNEKETTIVHEYNNKYETLMVFQEIEDAYLNPNGKQLLIKPKNEPVKLITIKRKETLFSFEKFEGIINIHTTQFSDDGNYVVLSQLTPQQGIFYNILDIKKREICISLRLSMNIDLSFHKKYVILRNGDKIYLISIKNLARINDHSASSHIYTIEEIIKRGMGKLFKNFEFFHPNGKHIVLKSNYQWQLIDPKTEKFLLVVDMITKSAFSKPMGKMLYLENAWYTGYKILSLRNDFTIKEYLLNRFMIEKNITGADLSQYPAMQEIYNKMDKDKLLFYCLKNETAPFKSGAF